MNKLPISYIEYALQNIREKIQDGTYPPGYKLVTQDISDELGISRTPVVAALNRLVAEGLAESLPRKGTIVAQLSKKKILEICEIRKMIELFVVPHAINNIDKRPDILKRMLEISDFLSSANYSDYDYKTVSKADYEFHTLFVELADNEKLLEIYKSNWSIGTPYYILRLGNAPLSILSDQFNAHSEFVSLLTNKDYIKLRDSLSEHIDQVNNKIIDIINNNDNIFNGDNKS